MQITCYSLKYFNYQIKNLEAGKLEPAITAKGSTPIAVKSLTIKNRNLYETDIRFLRYIRIFNYTLSICLS